MTGRDRRFDSPFTLWGRNRRKGDEVTGDTLDAGQLREVAAQMRDDANMIIDRIRVQYWSPLVQDAVATMLEAAAEGDGPPHPDAVAVAAAYRGERPATCAAIIVNLGNECTESPCRLEAGHGAHGQRHAP